MVAAAQRLAPVSRRRRVGDLRPGGGRGTGASDLGANQCDRAGEVVVSVSTAGRTDQLRGGGSHVAVIVENVPLGVDTRLRKQVRDLLAAGFHVSVVTMRSDDNATYRDLPGL